MVDNNYVSIITTNLKNIMSRQDKSYLTAASRLNKKITTFTIGKLNNQSKLN